MTHIHDKIDFTVSVYVVEGDAVLLRKHEKYGFWIVPGGHIELEEDPNQAALREVKEETGLDAKLVGNVPPVNEGDGYNELIPPRFLNIHQITGMDHYHVDHIYIARVSVRELSPAPGEQQEGLEWFTEEELEDTTYNLFDTTKHYARTALREVNA